MPLSRKLAILILEGKASLDDVVVLLEKYDLLTLLPFIKQSLLQLSHSAHKDGTMTIETPLPLSENSLTRIKEIAGDVHASHAVIINKNSPFMSAT